jgi:hypothetical protein
MTRYGRVNGTIRVVLRIYFSDIAGRLRRRPDGRITLRG